jgi:hypothetical protein
MLVALAVVASRFAQIGLLPPSIKLKQITHYEATTQVLVGEHSSLSSSSPELYTNADSARAQALGDMAASPEVLGYIARAAGVPASQIAVDAPLWGDLQRIQQWDTEEKRAYQVAAQNDPYRLELTDNFTAPIVDVTAQAPTQIGALRLAGAVTEGLQNYLESVETGAGTPPARRFVVSALAPVAVDPISGGVKNITVFTFVVVFAIWCGLVLLVANLVEELRIVRRRSQVPIRPERSSNSRDGWPGPSGLDLG